MKRFLIFTILFAPLTLLVFITPSLVTKPSLPPTGVLGLLLLLSYIFTIVPAWLSALIDWSMSAKPIHLRLPVTTGSAFILALGAAYSFGWNTRLISETILIGSMGAIPAAVCSWLSGTTKDGKTRERYRMRMVQPALKTDRS